MLRHCQGGDHQEKGSEDSELPVPNPDRGDEACDHKRCSGCSTMVFPPHHTGTPRPLAVRVCGVATYLFLKNHIKGERKGSGCDDRSY